MNASITGPRLEHRFQLPKLSGEKTQRKNGQCNRGNYLQVGQGVGCVHKPSLHSFTLFLCQWKGSGNVLANPRYGIGPKHLRSRGTADLNAMLHTCNLIFKPTEHRSPVWILSSTHLKCNWSERLPFGTSEISTSNTLPSQNQSRGPESCEMLNVVIYCTPSALFTVTCDVNVCLAGPLVVCRACRRSVPPCRSIETTRNAHLESVMATRDFPGATCCQQIP